MIASAASCGDTFPSHYLKIKGARGALENLAEWTGLEPATPGVTGRYSNQLNYHSALVQRVPRALRHGTKCWLYLATLRGFEPRYSP